MYLLNEFTYVCPFPDFDVHSRELLAFHAFDALLLSICSDCNGLLTWADGSEFNYDDPISFVRLVSNENNECFNLKQDTHSFGDLPCSGSASAICHYICDQSNPMLFG